MLTCNVCVYILKKLDKLTMPHEACYEREYARPTFHYIISFKEIKSKRFNYEIMIIERFEVNLKHTPKPQTH